MPIQGSRRDMAIRRVQTMTAAEFEQLTATETECMLRRRFRLFLGAGATPSGALLLAAQIEIEEQAAVKLLRAGFSTDESFLRLYLSSSAVA